MELNSTYYQNNSRIVTGTPIVYQDDVILLCDTSTGPVTINLLEIPDNNWMTTYKLYVIDNSSNASVNNITINAGVGQLINDTASVVISTNGEGCLVRVLSNNQYISTSSGGSVANTLEILDQGVSLTANADSIDFVGAGVTATNVGDNVSVNIPGNPLQIWDERFLLTSAAQSIDFIGSGVTATNVGDDVAVTIPGTQVLDETISLTYNATSINFTGDYVNATSVGNNVTVDVNAPDTGWVDLEGFEYQSAIGAPQCRKIGKVVHFRGTIIIPLSNDAGATLEPLTSGSAYVNKPYNQVFKSTNGLNKGANVNTAGSITFNLGASVIPTSILPALTNFDSSYSTSVIANRPIEVSGNYGACLSAYFNLIIRNDKRLIIQTVFDNEDVLSTAPNSGIGTMPLRFITSNVRTGDQVPNYVSSFSYIHNMQGGPVGTSQNLQSDANNLTYLFDCDAGNPEEIGGFAFKLDNLIAYIS